MWLSRRTSAHFSSMKCFCASVSLTLPFSTCSTFRRPQMCFQATLSCSSTDISSAGAGASSGVIDCVVTGPGFLDSATGAVWCASVRFGTGFGYSAQPVKAAHAHTIIAPSRICMICPRLDELWINRFAVPPHRHICFHHSKTKARDDRHPRALLNAAILPSCALWLPENCPPLGAEDEGGFLMISEGDGCR